MAYNHGLAKKQFETEWQKKEIVGGIAPKGIAGKVSLVKRCKLWNGYVRKKRLSYCRLRG